MRKVEDLRKWLLDARKESGRTSKPPRDREAPHLSPDLDVGGSKHLDTDVNDALLDKASRHKKRIDETQEKPKRKGKVDDNTDEDSDSS